MSLANDPPAARLVHTKHGEQPAYIDATITFRPNLVAVTARHGHVVCYSPYPRYLTISNRSPWLCDVLDSPSIVPKNRHPARLSVRRAALTPPPLHMQTTAAPRPQLTARAKTRSHSCHATPSIQRAADRLACGRLGPACHPWRPPQCRAPPLAPFVSGASFMKHALSQPAWVPPGPEGSYDSLPLSQHAAGCQATTP